jgi:hypothetical protein
MGKTNFEQQTSERQTSAFLSPMMPSDMPLYALLNYLFPRGTQL